MSPSFDLIGQPFVPCVRPDGTVAESGLRDVLVNAHEIAEVRDRSPLVTLALHRLLLAVLHAAYRGPNDEGERVRTRKAGRFDAKRITDYLAKFSDRFDLFSADRPFYQTANFKTAEPSGVHRLAKELSSGNNAALFDHTVDDPPPALTPAEAARAVIADQAFAVGGGNSDTGYTTSSPLVSAAVVLATGATLFETLWLNLCVYDPESEMPVAGTAKDAPVWERKPSSPHTESPQPLGYLDYLTWQTRTLRLHPEVEGGAVVVRRVSYAQGRKCEPAGEFFNPMVGYARKDTKEPFLPVRFNEYRDLWRDSAALFQLRDAKANYERGPLTLSELSGADVRAALAGGKPYKLAVLGLCTDKAKINFWRHESLPLPLAYLDDNHLAGRVKHALRLADVAADALRKAAWLAAGVRLTGDSGMKPDTDRVRNLVDSFAPDRLYWSGLERPYRKLLVDLGASGADQLAVVREWFLDTLRTAARRAFTESIGRIEDGRSWKAAAVGEKSLARSLRKIQRDEKFPDPETKEGAA